MIRASKLGRRTILVVGLSFILAAAGPAWKSVRIFRNLRQAREHVAQGSPQDAVPLLQDLAEMSPQRADLQYLLGVAQRRAGNVDLARPFLQRARELGWSPEDIDRQERLLVVQTGQAAWAEQLLQEAARTDTPDDAAEEIYESLAVGYLMAYQLRKAEQCLSDWIDWRPEAIPPRLLMAVLLKRVARTDDARLAYEEILAIAPEHRTAHLEYAILLLQENRIQEAFAHFKYCAEVDPQKMEARLGLAECYNRMGQAAESSAVLEFVMANAESESHRAVALVEMGRLAIKENRCDEAVEHLRAAVRIEPRDVAAHYTLGNALVKLDRLDDAREEFDLARELRAKLNRIAEINEILINDPSSADLRYEAGAILMELGLDRQALNRLQTVFLYDPRHRRTHEALAAYFEREGEIERAASHRRALAELDAEGASPSEDEGSTPPRTRDASGVQGAPPVSGELP